MSHSDPLSLAAGLLPGLAQPWVPVRSLSERHRPKVLRHLLALPEADRYLRFGHATSDAHISHYVDRIDFAHDAVFGIFNRRLTLVAVAHLAVLPEDPVAAELQAEFGVSVLPESRRRGFATRLFEHCMLHAATRNVDCLLVHALTQNMAMLAIANRAGASIEQHGPECEAWLRLPPATWRENIATRLEDQAAEWNYLYKLQAIRLGQMLPSPDRLRQDVADELVASGGLGRGRNSKG
jgi:GNAT superfamily N-acetyltransferase